MQLITGNPMVVFVLLYVVHNGKKIRACIFDVINFEQFFCYYFAKNIITKLKFHMAIAD